MHRHCQPAAGPCAPHAPLSHHRTAQVSRKTELDRVSVQSALSIMELENIALLPRCLHTSELGGARVGGEFSPLDSCFPLSNGEE